MRRQAGVMIQMLVLALVPLISIWQFIVGYRLVWMPMLLTISAVLFFIGTKLREG